MDLIFVYLIKGWVQLPSLEITELLCRDQHGLGLLSQWFCSCAQMHVSIPTVQTPLYRIKDWGSWFSTLYQMNRNYVEGFNSVTFYRTHEMEKKTYRYLIGINTFCAMMPMMLHPLFKSFDEIVRAPPASVSPVPKQTISISREENGQRCRTIFTLS